jgi:hypothetical protein
VRTLSVAVAASGMTFARMPPCTIVAEIPVRSTASKVGVPRSTRAPRATRAALPLATSAMARASRASGHTRASSPKKRCVVGRHARRRAPGADRRERPAEPQHGVPLERHGGVPARPARRHGDDVRHLLGALHRHVQRAPPHDARAPALVEGELAAHELRMVGDQPPHAELPARLLVGVGDEHHVARERPAAVHDEPLEEQHRLQVRREHPLVVDRTADRRGSRRAPRRRTDPPSQRSRSTPTTSMCPMSTTGRRLPFPLSRATSAARPGAGSKRCVSIPAALKTLSR